MRIFMSALVMGTTCTTTWVMGTYAASRHQMRHEHYSFLSTSESSGIFMSALVIQTRNEGIDSGCMYMTVSWSGPNDNSDAEDNTAWCHSVIVAGIEAAAFD